MDIEQPGSHEHGELEMTSSEFFQVFWRYAFVIFVLPIICNNRNGCSNNDDDKKTLNTILQVVIVFSYKNSN